MAAQKGHLSVVEYLVNQKADINAKDIFGKSNVVEFLKKKEEERNEEDRRLKEEEKRRQKDCRI